MTPSVRHPSNVPCQSEPPLGSSPSSSTSRPLAATTHGSLTVSLGVSTLPDDVVAAAALLPAADRALYLAKREGRNRVELA